MDWSFGGRSSEWTVGVVGPEGVCECVFGQVDSRNDYLAQLGNYPKQSFTPGPVDSGRSLGL